MCCLLSCTSLSLKYLNNVVPKDAAKQRLDVYLAGNYAQYSRSTIGNLCEKGNVLVNAKITAKNYKVRAGDEISLEILEKIETKAVAEYIPLDILYEDANMIAVNKPSGMVVHPAVGSPNGTFVNALLYHLGEESAERLLGTDNLTEDDDQDDVDLPETPEAAVASPVSLRPGIVHRLDKGTTGVLLAGKTTEAVGKLSKLFADRFIRKVYIAVCVGHPGEATIVAPIGRSPKNRQLMCTYDGPPGKMAITHIRPLAFDGKLSVCLVRIETGRTHQIRVHMQERRTPILGDDAYGNAQWNTKALKSDQIGRPQLHAYEMEFVHPFTGEKQTLRAPLPEDMAKLVAKIAGSTFLDDMDALTTGYDEDEDDEALRKSVFDTTTRMLTCSTAVAEESNMLLTDGSDNLDLVVSGNRKANAKFVPFDRLVIAEIEDEYTAFDVMEEEEE